MTKAMREAFYAEFEKRYGIRVVTTSPVDAGKLKAMVESGNVEWTVTEIGPEEAMLAEKQGLLEPLDRKVIDLSDYPEHLQDRKFIMPKGVYTTVLGYRKDAFPGGKGPQSWADFWDAKKFPGPRTLRDSPVDNLEFALMADGVAPDKLYPLDIDRAFKKLDEIKPHISVWWKTGAQSAQLLVDKEAIMGSAWNGRYYVAIKNGAPLHIEWNQGMIKELAFVIPKGAKDACLGPEDAGPHHRCQAAGHLRQHHHVSRSELEIHGVRAGGPQDIHADSSGQSVQAGLDRCQVVARERQCRARALEQVDTGKVSDGTSAAAAKISGRRGGSEAPHPDARVQASPAPSLLSLTAIAKSYGSVIALAGIDLRVPDGEIVTILGPSGSGKTTLLKIVAGFELPDAGRVELAGDDITCVTPASRGIGMVFQNYALFPHMRVAENIAFPPRDAPAGSRGDAGARQQRPRARGTSRL